MLIGWNAASLRDPADDGGIGERPIVAAPAPSGAGRMLSS
jgi:hypothetical protein